MLAISLCSGVCTSQLVVNPLLFRGCQSMTLEVKTKPVLCRSIPLISFCICRRKAFLENVPAFWRRGALVILDFDLFFSFPSSHATSRTTPSKPLAIPHSSSLAFVFSGWDCHGSSGGAWDCDFIMTEHHLETVPSLGGCGSCPEEVAGGSEESVPRSG